MRKLLTTLSPRRSGRERRTSSATTAEPPQLGEALRRRRLQRGLAVADVAAELGVPAKTLRALEWERRDLLGSTREAERLQRQYAAFLGEEAASLPQAAEAPPSTPTLGRVHAAWVPILVGLALTFATALVYFLGEAFGSGGTNGDGTLTSRNLRLLAVGLVSVSSLLLLAAVLPASVVARSPLAPASYARYRQPLALAAIGILAPVTLFALLLAIA